MIGVLQIKVIRQIGKIMVETWVALRPRRPAQFRVIRGRAKDEEDRAKGLIAKIEEAMKK